MKVSSVLHLVGGTATMGAAGAAVADATELSGGINVVNDATATTETGVRLPASYPVNVPLFVINTTAVALLVYPNTGGTINGGAANAAKGLVANLSGVYIQYAPGKWGAVLSA